MRFQAFYTVDPLERADALSDASRDTLALASLILLDILLNEMRKPEVPMHQRAGQVTCGRCITGYNGHLQQYL